MVAPRPAVVLPPGPPAHPGAVAFAQLAGLVGSGIGLGQPGQLAVAPPVQHAQTPMMLEACWSTIVDPHLPDRFIWAWASPKHK
eukprot:1142864-Alexandrium_andersonii.AAC.1